MSVDSTVVAYLAVNNVAREALKAVLKSKSIALTDLIERLIKDQATIDPEQAKDELRKLKEMHLVEAASSGIEDFDTYYVTASGLEAGRKVGI